MTANTATDHFDVLIVGAGISGIGAARYLKTKQPNKSFAILEGRANFGGTWDMFKYPGLRSDSDLHTFGYEFKPWKDKDAIASASKIMSYLGETLDENGLASHIRYHHKVVRAEWSSATARWTVEIERTDTGERTFITSSWIFSGAGYYNYDEGFTPNFEGRERFEGTIVHPQHWPEDLDYTGKRVVVIGSGATAVTLVPSMAPTAAHVTMLQRTPTYVMPVPRQDPFANIANRLLGDKLGYAVARRKNILQQKYVYDFAQTFPGLARKIIRTVNASMLPSDFPVDEHFNPPYNPWDQRLCAVPSGDLFKALSNGSASMVTDRIKTFTEKGILLESGRELEADIIVTATGLNIQILGGIELHVDGRKVNNPDLVAYRGTLLSGVPNLAMAIGYTNSSWTLKIGMLCEYFCDLLEHMDKNGYDTVWPVADPDMETRPLLDFEAGYVMRALEKLPKQGTAKPWKMSMSYFDDKKMQNAPTVDEHLSFSSPSRRQQRNLAKVS
ncbi:flavin-containing monooxygenase [Smaragdicoccus niigatensis]|uniref:flavin-containing monooxygenase n=1 Tax=Smaragdicoccus niigatensis TaxID=359359 RepID=UPI00037B7437|nr:NAD(P)/FAD-dependent oxidoreductase [Smaragdicoccus niigatensis]